MGDSGKNAAVFGLAGDPITSTAFLAHDTYKSVKDEGLSGMTKYFTPEKYFMENLTGKEMPWMDLPGTGQAAQNTFNWLEGKEGFAQHKNTFGNNPVGDFLNPMVGSETSTQRQYNTFQDAISKASLKKKASIAADEESVGNSLLT
jgi:hypothetical protein